MFNGKKLLELRLLNGMSRLDLAQKLEVTEQAVWQLEMNKVEKPDSINLLKLLNIFNVSIGYFEEKTLTTVVDSARIAFRNGDANSKRTIKIQEAYINKIDSLVKWLESYLITPEATIVKLLDEIRQLKQKGERLEEIALYARKYLGVSDYNDDLLFRLEKSGINILSKILDIEQNADAYSLWTTNDTPYLILGKGKSAVRRNFDLAHELGHLLLHSEIDFGELDTRTLQKVENEANLFASYFLLPEVAFREAFERSVGKKVSNPDQYIGLKQRFNVSIQALEYRDYRLGYLTSAQNSYFYRVISNKGYKKLEPLDREIVVKKPAKIQSMIDILLKNNVFTLKSFLNQHKVTVQFISQHLDIKLDFFEPYQEKEDNYGTLIRLSDYQQKA